MANTPRNPVGAVSPEFQQSYDRLKAAVGAVPAKLKELRDKVDTGMTQAEVSGFQADMDQLSSGLEAALAEPTPPAPTP